MRVRGLRIGLGQRYVGSIDELLILDRAPPAATIAAIARMNQPLRADG